MPARLEILGSGRLVSDSGRELLRPGIPLAVLAYLHLTPTPVSREHLAALFWPDSPRPRGRQSLRQTLSRVRRALGPEALVSRGANVALGEDALVSDVSEVRVFLSEDRVEEALERWGGLLLQDLTSSGSWEFEEWLERERATLAGRLGTAVEVAAARALEAEDPARALALTEAASPWLPFRPLLSRASFDALVALGRLPAAAALAERARSEGEERLAGAMDRVLREEARPADAVPRAPAPTGDRASSWPAVLAALAAVLLLALVPAAAYRGVGEESARTTTGAPPDMTERSLYCSRAGTAGQVEQLFQMTMDGLNKHRVTSLPGCEAIWLPRAGEGGGLVVHSPGREGGAEPAQVPGLHLLVPDPDHPQAEWLGRPLESVRGLEVVTLQRPWSRGVEDRKVLFTARDGTEGTVSVFLLDPMLDRWIRVTDEAGNEEHPAWDPVRGEVLFSSDRGGDGPSLWAQRLSPGPEDVPLGAPQRLTASPLPDTRPVPWGDEVVFVRGFDDGLGDQSLGLWLMDRGATGNPVRPLVNRPWNDYDAVWSPDGRHLCWQSEEFGHFESAIDVMEVTTERVVRVSAPRSGRNASCLWTADSDHLLYRSTSAAGIPQVERVRRSGAERVDLSRTDHASHPVAQFH